MGKSEVRKIIYVSGFAGLLQGIQRYLVPITLIHYGWSLSQYGAVYFVQAIAMTLPMFFSGIISDIKGRVVIISLSFALFAFGSLLFMLSIGGSNLFFILISQIITTIASGISQVGLATILADETKLGYDRTNSYGLQATLKNIAMFVGPLLMGVYIDYAKPVTIVHYYEVYETGFLILTGLSVIGIFFSFVMPETSYEVLEERKSAKLEDFDDGQKKMYTSFTVEEMLIGLTSGLIVPFIDYYILDHFAPSGLVWGLVFGLSNSSIALGSFVVGRYSERIGKGNMVMLLNSFAPVFALFIAISGSFWVVSVFYILRAGFANAVQPAWQSWFFDHTPSTFRGRSMSVLQINRRLARAGGTALGPFLFTALGTALFPLGCLFYPFAMAIPRKTEQTVLFSPIRDDIPIVGE